MLSSNLILDTVTKKLVLKYFNHYLLYRLQLRRCDDRPRTPRVRRNNIGAIWHHLAEINRLLPHRALVRHVAVPRFRFQYVLVTTAAVIGLYAYFRMADAFVINNSFPVR